jgi:hypothetical protein
MVKTVRVSDKLSNQLTVLVGKITAEKLARQTYSDAIKYLLDHHIVFPPELVSHIEELIKNKQLGYSSKEGFLYDAVRRTLKLYGEDIVCIYVRRDRYEKVKAAIEELGLPFTCVDDFIEEQADKLLEQYDQWKEQKEEAEKS